MCLSALADLVVKNQIITVNSNQFGALHFINAPYNTRSAIAPSKAKVIALSQAEAIAILNLNQQADGDRTFNS
jgi:hypothetical protein